jgi:hypothetical protein
MFVGLLFILIYSLVLCEFLFQEDVIQIKDVDTFEDPFLI